ncbi:MAG: helix-turn-helix domain-containing protein [Acidobacteriia bacterium]|nr:helix-turn-helix domain-containing protein [Terriglobia bacterium]
MFSVQVKFKVGDREVPLERFAALFFKEVLRLTQEETRPKPTPELHKPVVVPPAIHGQARKELEPRAVGLAEASRLLGVSQHTVRKHVRQQIIPSVRIGRRVLIPMQTINDLTMKGAK